MKSKVTNRGFGVYEFNDQYGSACSIQESSCGSEAKIWVGVNTVIPQKCIPGRGWVNLVSDSDINDPNTLASGRMHLNQKQVKDMLPLLKYFAKHGCLPEIKVDSIE